MCDKLSEEVQVFYKNFINGSNSTRKDIHIVKNKLAKLYKF